jgi:outer membrane protein TolC
MKHNLSTQILLSLILFFANRAMAADTNPGTIGMLTLESAIAQAEENTPELKGLKASAEKASWEKIEAMSGFMPHLTAGYDHYLSSTYMRENILFGGSVVSFPAAFPQDNLAVDASWTLFDGFDTLHKYRAAELNTDAANLELSRVQFRLRQAVRLAYFQALAAQKLYEVTQQNVSTLEDHLKRAHITEKAGYGTQFDVLRIEATLEDARADEEEAENNVQINRSHLREAMGIDTDDTRPLAGQLPVLKENDVPKDLSLAMTDRDDLKAQQKREAASQELRSAAKSFWYPSVSVFAEEQFYQFGNFDPAVQSNSSMQNASFVGLRLHWNLFDGGYSYARSQEAIQTAIETQTKTRRALIKLPDELDTWKRKYFNSISLYKARLRALAQFQESVRLAAIGVKAGSRTHTEMLDAELDLFRARGGLVKAQADAIESLGNLELAIGHKLVDDKAFH